MRSAQVHRFGDRVGAYLGSGPTNYLTPKEARAFAKALNRAARSCETEQASKATCGTALIPLSLPEA